MKYEISYKFPRPSTLDYVEFGDYVYNKYDFEVKVFSSKQIVIEIKCPSEEAILIKLKFPEISIREVK